MAQVTLHAGQIELLVTDEGDFGWCGISKWQHKEYKKKWLLCPAFTLEHYIGIPMDSEEYVDYEPCNSPKRLENITRDSCVLHYEPTACSQVDCTITYRLSPPHYVDVDICMMTERDKWPLNHLALFFATIVNTPVYTGINIWGDDIGLEQSDKRWIHFNGMAAQSGRTIHPLGMQKPELPRPIKVPDTYYYDDSSVRFASPYFYAPVENMAFAVMFRPKDKSNVRFVVNPLAPAFGGPAWDFLWTIPLPKKGGEYKLSYRGLFKPYVDAEDIVVEYDKFVQGN